MSIGNGTTISEFTLLSKFPLDSECIYETEYGGKLRILVYCISDGKIITKTFNNPNIFNSYIYDHCYPNNRERKLERILNNHKKYSISDAIELNKLRNKKVNLIDKISKSNTIERKIIQIELSTLKKKIKEYETRIKKRIE